MACIKSSARNVTVRSIVRDDMDVAIFSVC